MSSTEELIRDLADAADAVQDAHFCGWGRVTKTISRAINELSRTASFTNDRPHHWKCTNCNKTNGFACQDMNDNE